MTMPEVDVSSPREQRNFGLVMGAAIALLGLLRWALHGFEHFPLAWFALAAAFVVLALAAPVLLKPLFAAWMRLAAVLNWVSTRVFLGIAFYLLITPVRLVLRIFADDPLKRQWLPEADTYWEEPEEQPDDIRRYRNQF